MNSPAPSTPKQEPTSESDTKMAPNEDSTSDSDPPAPSSNNNNNNKQRPRLRQTRTASLPTSSTAPSDNKKGSRNPTFNPRTAADATNAAICREQNRDGTIAWDEISERVSRPAGSKPCSPVACADRWHRNRIMFEASEGRDVRPDWLREWVTELSPLPAAAGSSEERACAKEVKRCLARGQDVPAEAVRGCSKWLVRCVRDVEAARRGGGTGGEAGGRRVVVGERLDGEEEAGEEDDEDEEADAPSTDPAIARLETRLANVEEIVDDLRRELVVLRARR